MFGIVLWSGTVAFAATRYVDCNLASYAGHDGTSWAQAYKTIQEGVNACSAGDTVLVAAGRYAEGGGQWNGCLNRVLVEKRDITVRSVAGKGETFIVGAHDPDPVDEYGNGPNAVRCVRLDADNVVIEGFTLTDGASQPSYLREDAEKSNGGAVCSGNAGYSSCLVDCVVTNCTGVRGGATYNAVLVRCLLVGNSCAGKGAAGNNSRFLNCVLTRNWGIGGGSLCCNCTVVNCTIVRNATSFAGSEASSFRNCIAILNAGIGDAPEQSYLKLQSLCSVFPAREKVGGMTYFRSEDGSAFDADENQLVNPLFDDWRLNPDSVGIGRGILDYYGVYSFWMPDRVNRFVDFEGRAIPTSGPVNVGALQSVGPACEGGSLQFDKAGVCVDGARTFVANEYVNATNYPQQFLVSARAEEGRRLYGFKRFGPGVSTYLFTRPDDTVYMLPPKTGCYTNELVWAGHVLYVDPSGSDGNDGLAADRPLRTIQAAVDKTDSIGYFCLSCAAGIYDGDDGCQELVGMKNRVTIPTGRSVRIVGAGVGRSVLKGAADPDRADGRGPKAMRCLLANTSNGSCIQGFTLTGGRTSCQDNGESGYGGGVYCVNTYAYVENCVVSNNAAQRGGGMHRGTAVGSRFFDNWAQANRAAMSEGRMAGCIVDHNRGVNASQNTVGLWNCTFGEDNTDLAGKATNLAGMPYGPVVNCLFKGCFQIWADQWTPPPPSCTNCVFGSIDDYLGVGVFADCQTRPVDEIALDDAYAPVIGACAAVDAGFADAEAVAICGGTDIWGGQRVYNGRIDVGAVEADWRAHYAAAMGDGVSVAAVSPEAVLENGRLRLPSGARVIGGWKQRQPGRKTRYSYSLAATDGTLAGKLGDTARAVTDAAETHSFKTVMDEVGFAFAFDGSGFGELYDFSQFVPGTLLLVK